MQRYKIYIEYDGTGYVGWQRQKGKLAICTEIEAAIYAFSGEKVEIYGSGRTDAGVHAISQVAHFDLHKTIICEKKIVFAINFYLKHTKISILKSEMVSNDFHARFSAIERSYVYKILNRVAPPKLQVNRVWHLRDKLNLIKMQDAANYLVGTHDFSSLRARECQANSPVKTINEIKIFKQQNNEILIYVAAPSFLHHMVRNIVGTLRLIGNDKISYDEFTEKFKQKKRSLMGETAPACGLYLLDIKY